MKATLANVPGRISLTLDAWTSVAQEGYLGITAHWVTSDFVLNRVLLDFCEAPAEHSGENLKNEVLAILNEYGIAHKTLGWTMDGASNMNKFFDDLKPELQLERQNQKVVNQGKHLILRIRNTRHNTCILDNYFVSVLYNVFFFSVPEFRVRCVCHAINNVAEVGIEDDQKIVSRLRDMVKAVRRPKARKQYMTLRESEKDHG